MNATPKTNTPSRLRRRHGERAATVGSCTHANTSPLTPARAVPPHHIDKDELLLAVLRRSLTRADQFIARRTLLRAAPLERCAHLKARWQSSKHFNGMGCGQSTPYLL
jgi:hypothetical protein